MLEGDQITPVDRPVNDRKSAGKPHISRPVCPLTARVAVYHLPRKTQYNVPVQSVNTKYGAVVPIDVPATRPPQESWNFSRTLPATASQRRHARLPGTLCLPQQRTFPRLPRPDRRSSCRLSRLVAGVGSRRLFAAEPQTGARHVQRFRDPAVHFEPHGCLESSRNDMFSGSLLNPPSPTLQEVR